MFKKTVDGVLSAFNKAIADPPGIVRRFSTASRLHGFRLGQPVEKPGSPSFPAGLQVPPVWP